MAKYNFELKKKIVLRHLSLGVGSKALAKKYNVKSARQFDNGFIIIMSLVRGRQKKKRKKKEKKESRQKNNYSAVKPI